MILIKDNDFNYLNACLQQKLSAKPKNFIKKETQ